MPSPAIPAPQGGNSADRARLSSPVGAESFSIPPRCTNTAANRRCCEAEPPAGTSAERDCGHITSANGSDTGILGALSSHRPVKLEGCVNPTAAPLQTIAALGAQARDDLTDQITKANSFFHGEHNV